MPTPDELRRLVYTPTDISKLTMKIVDARVNDVALGLKTGIPTLDQVLLPAMPGELIIVLARPSNYKSGFMQFWSKQVAKQIVARPEFSHDICVYVTWEMAVEELGFYDLANAVNANPSKVWYGEANEQTIKGLREASHVRSTSPLWMLGHSMGRSSDRIPLTIQSVEDALVLAQKDYGVRPGMIFLDYLQQIDCDRGEERRLAVLYNVDRAKDLARHLNCPVVLAVQAGRQVDEREIKLPQLGDGQETSRVEQAADKLLALWMPKMTEPIGSTIASLQMEVTNDALLLGIRKQRLGVSGNILKLKVDPARNNIIPQQNVKLN